MQRNDMPARFIWLGIQMLFSMKLTFAKLMWSGVISAFLT